MKAIELNTDARAIDSSYAYLLHLMGENERSKEYIEIQRNLDDKKKDKNTWTHSIMD